MGAAILSDDVNYATLRRHFQATLLELFKKYISIQYSLLFYLSETELYLKQDDFTKNLNVKIKLIY